ncbi:MAG TPA: TSUP family transporter, partial [Paracoccaceae bacterium]
GIIGGLYGGVSGVWGPPVLVYLLSTGAGKLETVRVQGVIFLIGAAVLLGAHLNSGVMSAKTLPFSAALVVPAMIGLSLGYAVQDRLDHQRFRRWTQVLLVLTGLNLMRRAIGL